MNYTKIRLLCFHILKQTFVTLNFLPLLLKINLLRNCLLVDVCNTQVRLVPPAVLGTTCRLSTVQPSATHSVRSPCIFSSCSRFTCTEL